jgi:hypothetical protein
MIPWNSMEFWDSIGIILGLLHNENFQLFPPHPKQKKNHVKVVMNHFELVSFYFLLQPESYGFTFVAKL